MTNGKWIETNIHVRHPQLMDRVLLTFVKDYIYDLKKGDKIHSWHFLREGFDIRLRTLVDQEYRSEIANELDKRLKMLEQSEKDIYVSHTIGGAHGNQNAPDYAGEVESLGEKGWQVFEKYLNHCSEVVLEFLEKEPRDNPEKPWSVYLERFFHCLFNQIGPDPLTKLQAVGPEVAIDALRIFLYDAETPAMIRQKLLAQTDRDSETDIQGTSRT